MESIRELREICQGSPHVKSNDTRYAHFVARKFSIYFTWILLHTPISANQATLLFIMLGVLSSAFFVPGNYWYALSGAALLQVWFIFDCVDGEIARYRKTSSVTGSYFDLMAHDIVNSILFSCLSIGVFYRHDNPIIFAFGFSVITSFFLIKLSWLSIVRTLLVEGRHSENKDLPSIENTIRNMTKSNSNQEAKGIMKLYAKVSFLFRFPSIMNILLLMTVLDRIDILIYVYGSLLPLIWIAQLYRNIRRGIV